MEIAKVVRENGNECWIKIGDFPLLRYPAELHEEAQIYADAVNKALNPLLDAAEKMEKALEHTPPNGCWATGPLTGDPIVDFAVCPGCVALAAYQSAKGKP